MTFSGLVTVRHVPPYGPFIFQATGDIVTVRHAVRAVLSFYPHLIHDLPCKSFIANWVWRVIARLAYNLAQFFKLLVLPTRKHHYQLKKLRLHWFCVAGRIIRSGRRITWVKYSRTINDQLSIRGKSCCL